MLAVPFGLSGLAFAWSNAHVSVGAWAGADVGLWALAGLAWLVLSAAWLWDAASAHRLHADLHHPLLGPFIALIPVVAILLGGELARFAPGAGLLLVALAVAGITVFSAWSLTAVVTGAVDARIFHAGYYLFILAGALIGAIGLAEAGARRQALAAFTIGIFFWAVLAAVIIARLVVLPALPSAYLPTLAIFSVPPSVAGLAWFGVHGPGIDWVQETLLALTVFLLVGQAFLVPHYARLPFSMAYWSFTFTAAAPASYGIRWLAATGVPGWRAWTWVILVAVTAWIGWIAACSILRPARTRHGAS